MRETWERGVSEELVEAVMSVASAVTPRGAMPGHDATGGSVGSLTEAVMGITAGLCKVASAIDNLADAVRERGE